MTITYLLNGEGPLLDSDCTPALGNNEPAVRGDTLIVSRNIPQATTDEISLSWTTMANAPGVADWPSGDYIMRANISTIDAGASVKYQLLRIDSVCGAEETLGTSGSVSTTGDKTFTVNTDPASGALGDRFQARILGSNSDPHMEQAFSINPEATSFDAEIEGPWVVGGIAIPIVYHHRQRNF